MAASLPTSLKYGGDSVNDSILQILDSEERMLDVAKDALPAWMTSGFRDYSCTIHSVGCSYFSALGDRMGLQAVSELPIEQHGDYAFVGSDVRCDSAWFTKDTFKLMALVEFERYDGARDMDDLISKVKNLALACHRSPTTPALSILAYWTKNSQQLPDHNQLRTLFRSGFETSERQRVPGVRGGVLRIFQLVHETVAHSDRWRLWRIKERAA